MMDLVISSPCLRFAKKCEASPRVSPSIKLTASCGGVISNSVEICGSRCRDLDTMYRRLLCTALAPTSLTHAARCAPAATEPSNIGPVESPTPKALRCAVEAIRKVDPGPYQKTAHQYGCQGPNEWHPSFYGRTVPPTLSVTHYCLSHYGRADLRNIVRADLRNIVRADLRNVVSVRHGRLIARHDI